MLTYEYIHIISFEETNLVGNVYYVNHLRWQGRCREMFLQEHAPCVLVELSNGLALATVKVSCEYFSELFAFDKIAIRMQLKELKQNRITMLFEYWRITNDSQELVARGEQQVACMRRQGKATVATPIPKALQEALYSYVAPDFNIHVISQKSN
ncbi:4-hydroxybenzoyl-CoA thioesterase [Dulcicalothrix desertica PCC 7102]|uniref:4-hydroxybenzoyl-CoA thioesterase n=1 Tax=Dulcicalothrix desertica PCC 7102 TaxID=232991 RepID=A0A433V9N4_9CYAN|nr:acyl-CoA thioesterase [Dulcicalothrix desertica]RUT02783.1 4-hydroxybenzoyl-CoA thioesterase [Dulcicalothrix desertica PCC 7102]TWH38983.1 enediyne biosynthesis thioesterase [Dulcicalothrix desertica PCC 7102]